MVSTDRQSILIAHAVIMSLVMVVLYPLGSALMPLLGNWMAHGVWQGTSYLLMWAGFALGVVVARQRHMVCLLWLIQPPMANPDHTLTTLPLALRRFCPQAHCLWNRRRRRHGNPAPPRLAAPPPLCQESEPGSRQPCAYLVGPRAHGPRHHQRRTGPSAGGRIEVCHHWLLCGFCRVFPRLRRDQAFQDMLPVGASRGKHGARCSCRRCTTSQPQQRRGC